MMQTGCKLVALRANGHLCIVAEATVAAPQKGHARHRQMFLLLGRMAIVRRIVNLISAMYKDNGTTFEVSGCPVAIVSVHRGVRQGCPMSGSLFMLALDPLVRWLMWRPVLRSARFFAFADDLAAVLDHTRESRPFLMEALRR